jgi:hypothetical protein
VAIDRVSLIEAFHVILLRWWVVVVKEPCVIDTASVRIFLFLDSFIGFCELRRLLSFCSIFEDRCDL